MKKYTVDRFEGDKAVLLLRADESIHIDVERNQLPANLKAGDIVEVDFDSDNNVVDAKVLKEETEAARKKASELLQKILDKNKE